MLVVRPIKEHRNVSDYLVGISEIAEETGNNHNTVANWPKRYADFPEPIAELRCGRIYLWSEIETWLADAEDA